MNRRATILNLSVLILLAAFMVSCNSLKKMAKNYDSITYQVTPEVLETKGGVVSVSITANIPPKFFHRKAAVYLQPELVYENGTTQLKGILVKGEKVEGEGVTISYSEGGTVTYSDAFNYTPDMNESELVVNPMAFIPKVPLSSSMTLEDVTK
nr:hypothetical protein [Bacteroidota bacterium]